MPLREVVIDTETTGLSPTEGHKIVEIGLVELIDRKATGRFFHQYINPRRASDLAAFRVHGLSERFLRHFPVFENVAGAILDFIQDAPLVAHNAPFDIGFLNYELGERISNKIVDTYELANEKFPGTRNSLDALVARYKVKFVDRSMHGAILDANILSRVYYHLTQEAEPQAVFDFSVPKPADRTDLDGVGFKFPRRSFRPTEAELSLHQEMLSGIKNPIWLRQQQEASPRP
jgi:exonuclease, DNA polymerase III, epsilon subunit family